MDTELIEMYRALRRIYRKLWADLQRLVHPNGRIHLDSLVIDVFALIIHPEIQPPTRHGEFVLSMITNILTGESLKILSGLTRTIVHHHLH